MDTFNKFVVLIFGAFSLVAFFVSLVEFVNIIIVKLPEFSFWMNYTESGQRFEISMWILGVAIVIGTIIQSALRDSRYHCLKNIICCK